MAATDTFKYYGFSKSSGLNRIFRTPDSEDEKSEYSFRFQCDKKISNNITIMGMPGTGKSTLALTMAAGLRYWDVEKNDKNNLPDNSSILYFSLEQSKPSILERLNNIEPKAKPVENVSVDFNKGEKINEAAEKGKNIIFFPSLSPLPLRRSADTASEVRGEGIFWQRYDELKQRIELLQSEDIKPPLRMVVIDSLSMFADVPLSRYMVDQLFELFAEHDVLGVLILESNSAHCQNLSQSNADVTAAADVVIDLKWCEKDNYSFRQINVTKSRHSPNNYGNHLMKIRDAGCQVFPSLHAWHPYLVNLTKGINFSREKYPQRGCRNILLYGPKHTHKVEFALDLLRPENITVNPDSIKENVCLEKFFNTEGENGSPGRPKNILLISFGETSRPSDIDSSSNDAKEKAKDWLPNGKGSLYKLDDEVNGWMLTFNSGFLLPEELIWYIDQACEKFEKFEKLGAFSTIVFHNINSWEYSYPMLYENLLNHQDNFFPILRRYCLYKNLSCIFTFSEDKSANDFNQPLLRTLLAMSQVSIRMERSSNNNEEFNLTYDMRDSHAEYTGTYKEKQENQEKQWSIKKVE